jgi:hypothetical protein
MRWFTTKRGYDRALDPTTWGTRWNPILARRGAPEWRKEMMNHKISTASKKQAQKVRDGNKDKREQREEAERDMAEAIRRCVRVLEMGMVRLKDIGVPPGEYQKSILQHSLHNAIFYLKNKCGVSFKGEDEEYMEAVREDTGHRKTGYKTLYERMKEKEDEQERE